MSELPPGEIVKFYKGQVWDEHKSRVVKTDYAEIRFDNGTRVYTPASRLPPEARLHSRVRWTDRFGGELELSHNPDSRPVMTVQPSIRAEPLF